MAEEQQDQPPKSPEQQAKLDRLQQLMDVDDKVKLIKGNPFGKVGIIKSVSFMTKPVDLSADPVALDKAKPEKNFLIEAEDGTTFTGFEDQLEFVND